MMSMSKERSLDYDKTTTVRYQKITSKGTFVIESLLRMGREWVSMVFGGIGFLILEFNVKNPKRKLICTSDKMDFSVPLCYFLSHTEKIISSL